MNLNRSSHLLMVLVCVFVFFAVAQAAAAQGPSFGLAPYSIEKGEPLPRLDYSLAAGQSQPGAVLVTNPGEKAAYLRLSAVDARTSMHGGVSFPDSSEPLSAVGGWISLSETEPTLQPGEESVIPFTIAVPPNTPAGEYRAGILLEAADPDTARPADVPEGGIHVAVLFRKALNVRVTVPGAATADLKIASVRHVFEESRSVFQVELHNEGNVPAEVTGGKLEVLDASGKVIGMQPIKMSGKFLAKDTVLYPIQFDQALPVGQYGVRVSVDYDGHTPATWESTFEVTKAEAKPTATPIDTGFDLPTEAALTPGVAVTPAVTPGPVVPELPDYWMYVAIGLLCIVLIGFVVIVVGVVWFRRRK